MQIMLQKAGGPGASARQQAERLADVIAFRGGLRGDRDDYDNPANADFLAMFERRRGLPVTLAILYVALARRFDIEAAVIGLPGHVLVRIGGADIGSGGADTGSGGTGGTGAGESALLDAFSNGAIVETGAMGRRDAAATKARLSNRATLVRLLTNQAARARNAGDPTRALLLFERMTLIAPQFTGLWWERAQLEQQLGQPAAARQSLVAMRETSHQPDVARRIDAALAALTASKR